jgi:hypothetical protein
MGIHITLTLQDVQFFDRDFREHHMRIECAAHCDGVPCRAPGAPHDPLTPHFHLVYRAPDLDREFADYVDPNGTWRNG